MTDTRIARRYASAIFALGENEGKTANAKRGETLKALDSLLDESPALDRVFKSPIITVAEKKKIVGDLLDKLDADPVTRNFCFLLADKDRLAFFRAIVQAFSKKLDEAQQIIRGKLTTAIALSAAKQKAVKAWMRACARNWRSSGRLSRGVISTCRSKQTKSAKSLRKRFKTTTSA